MPKIRALATLLVTAAGAIIAEPKCPRLADAVLICTQDAMHVEPAVAFANWRKRPTVISNRSSRTRPSACWSPRRRKDGTSSWLDPCREHSKAVEQWVGRRKRLPHKLSILHV